MFFPNHGGNPGAADTVAFVTRFCEAVRPERVIFPIGHNQNSFPNTQVIQAIEKALPSIQMYTTGSSDVLINHIGEDVESPHKDCVGTICLVINENPLDFSFSNS